MRDIDPQIVEEVFRALQVLAHNSKLYEKAEDQKINAQDQGLKECYRKLAVALEVGKFPTIAEARNGPRAQTNMSALIVLTVGKMEVWIRALLAEDPELTFQVVRRQGLNRWPYLKKVFPNLLQGIQAHQLLGFVAHKDIAVMLASKSVELANELARQRGNVSEQRERLKLLSGIIASPDMEAMKGSYQRYRNQMGVISQLTTAIVVPLGILKLHQQAEIALRAVGITTIGDLLEWPAKELIQIPGIRAKRLAQINCSLKAQGYPEIS